MLQISRRHTMATRHNIVRADNAWVHECPHQVFLRILRRLAVKTEIAGFRSDDYFIAGGCSGTREVLQSLTNGPFAPLKPVVDGGVQNIRSALDGDKYSLPVIVICCKVRLPQ